MVIGILTYDTAGLGAWGACMGAETCAQPKSTAHEAIAADQVVMVLAD